MSPNFVFQQLISDKNSTVPPNMPIYPLRLIQNQWSMADTSIHFCIHWNGLYNQNLIPQFTAMQHHKWAWTASQWNCRPHFQPYQPLQSEDSLVPPFSHLWWARRRPEWQGTWSGVGAESKQRKVGGATGPQVGERVNAQPMLDDGGEGFCGCDTILSLIFSLVRITFVVGFLRIKIHVAFR